jgi:hypothetical protein
MEFNQNFKIIKGDTLTLKLIETCVGDDKVIPFYYYDEYFGQFDISSRSI